MRGRVFLRLRIRLPTNGMQRLRRGGVVASLHKSLDGVERRSLQPGKERRFISDVRRKVEIEEEEGFPRDYVWSFGILVASSSVIYLGASAVVPMLPMLAGGETTATTVGLALAAPPLARLACNSGLGYASDRFGRVPVIVIGGALAASATIATGLASSAWALVPARLAYGAGGAAMVVGTNAWLTDLTALPRVLPNRGLILGSVAAVNNSIWALGPALGGSLTAVLASPSFALGGLGSCMMAASFATLLIKETPVVVSSLEESKEKDDFLLSRFVKSKTQRGILVANAAVAMNYATLMAVVPLRCTELGINDLGLIAQLYGVMALVGITSGPVSGYCCDVYGRLAVMIPGLSVCATATLLMALAPDINSFCLAALLRSAGEGFAAPVIFAATSDEAPSRHRGVALAMARNAGDLAYFLSAPSLGFLADLSGTSSTPLLTASGLTGLSALFVSYHLNRFPRSALGAPAAETTRKVLQDQQSRS